jgi:hypothetical protein
MQTLLIASAMKHPAPNARQFYDDTATIIPILLLAVLYQAQGLHPTPRFGRMPLAIIATLTMVGTALAEIECLHVAAGYNPTRIGATLVEFTMVFLFVLIAVQPIVRISATWNETRAVSPSPSLRKNLGYRASLVILVGGYLVVAIIALMVISPSGKP